MHKSGSDGLVVILEISDQKVSSSSLTTTKIQSFGKAQSKTLNPQMLEMVVNSSCKLLWMKTCGKCKQVHCVGKIWKPCGQ